MFPIPGLLMVISGLFLSHFTYRRFNDYRRDRHDVTNRFYLMAGLWVSSALFLYGIPSFFYQVSPVPLRLAAIGATVLNVIGFGYFLRVALYAWLSPNSFSLASHAIALYAVLVAVVLVLFPPDTYIDQAGIIHWSFTLTESVLILALNISAFASSILLLYLNFRALLDRTWIARVSAMILTFVLSGIGGGYLYIGDDSMLLGLASVILCCGLFIEFIGSFLEQSA